MVVLVVQPVVDCRDATHHFAVALGDEVVGFGVLKERVVGAVEKFLDLGAKRRDPIEIPPMKPIRQVDEPGEVPGRLDAPDRRRGVQMTPSSLPMRPNASSAKSIC
jgi:hypothetical protein